MRMARRPRTEPKRTLLCPAGHDRLVFGSAVGRKLCHGRNRVEVSDVEWDAAGRPDPIPADDPRATNESWIPGLST
jgi:hypothetical protein